MIKGNIQKLTEKYLLQLYICRYTIKNKTTILI